jgi:hypothetical protein
MTAEMKRKPQPTKRERKAQDPIKTTRPAVSAKHEHDHQHQHIHCIACGRHLEQEQFTAKTAVVVTCEHGSRFPSCSGCAEASQALLDEHDKTGQPVRAASAWH